MATLQRIISKLNLRRIGAAIVTGTLVLGSLVVVATDAEAAGLPVVSDPLVIGTEFPSTTEIATLLTNQVDPVVVDSETTELEFADAVIDDSYTETGPVNEELGDQQQIDAVEQALQEQTEEISPQEDGPSDTQGIARIDLEADVAVVGVTWDLNAPQPESVYWRYLTGGMWTEWGTIEPEVNDSVKETRGGTEPLTLANVQAVEVVAKTETGIDISGLTLHVINAENFAPAENILLDIYPEQIDEDIAQSGEPTVEEDENQEDQQSYGPAETDRGDKVLDTDGLVETDGVSLSNSVAETMLGIVPMAGLNADGTIYDTGFEGLKIGTRKAWCTGDCKQVSIWTPDQITIKGAVVHHTEGNNNYTQAQVPQQLRNVYQWQAVSRGWGDIGYNLVVDKYGGVWEGRYGGLTKGIQGAHAYGANYDTFGITVLGSYTSAAPPTVARQAMSKAIAWKLNLHGVKSATEKIKVQAQWVGGATVPRVSAHRDVGWTDCPGDAFYKQMDTVRSEVNTYLAKLNTTGSTTTPSASTFNPGNVVSDAVFYNPGAMTEAQIKAFIESAGSSCTSSGSSKCLKDMTFSTAKLDPIRVKSGGCSALNLTGNQRPWTIIDKAAKACGLNPQVILVTIQKEQSGLTQPKTDAVWAKAMGAGCPDNSGCDAAQAGFTKQIYYGAEKLATYRINATWEQYILAFQNGQSVTVQNNAGTACGSQTFRLENYATASLYMYTPYVGNSSGSSCPAIGQKMFWDLMKRYFPSSLPAGGTWVLNGGAWYYKGIGGENYTGWLNDSGNWYYLGSTGAMQTGWADVGGDWYYLNSDGAMATGWKRFGTAWYYLNSDGAMATGWKQVGKTWYYLNSDGAMVTGWNEVDGSKYYMAASGAMVTGWKNVGNGRYYFSASGAMVTGWKQVGKTWYYLNSDGAMATGWKQVGKTWYYLNSDGAMATGWKQVGKTWYYLNSDGAMATGWKQIGKTWYYLNSDGAMATGWKRLDGNWYYLSVTGGMATGWKQLAKSWYYLDGSGVMRTGWIHISGRWYYLSSSGAMVTGDQIVDGKLNRFNTSGAWIGVV